jgi:hypothetical protein
MSDSDSEGVNVAVAPATARAPGVIPAGLPSEKLVAVMLVGSSAPEKSTLSAPVGLTPVAPSLGTTETTVKGVEQALPVQATGHVLDAPHCPSEPHVCTEVASAQRASPGVHTPPQTSPVHTYTQVAELPHSPVAPHVSCTPLLQRVAPGVQAPMQPLAVHT